MPTPKIITGMESGRISTGAISPPRLNPTVTAAPTAPKLTSAGVPMCFVYGTADPTVPPAVASRYRELVPGAALVELPDIGHYPHVEAPDRCLRAVLNFHDSITPAP